MLNLNGVILPQVLQEINKYTSLRFRDPALFVCPEAVSLYEQGVLDVKRINELCEEAYGKKLEDLSYVSVPDEIIKQFSGTDLVPIMTNLSTGQVDCIILPEKEYTKPLDVKDIIVHEVYPYCYYKVYGEVYGKHPDLLPMPPKVLLEFIIREAIENKGVDVTISTRGNKVEVYYNNLFCYKNIINKTLYVEEVDAIVDALTTTSPMPNNRMPKNVGADLIEGYRGRINIMHSYKGKLITIRILPNETFNSGLEDLHLEPTAIQFLRETFGNIEEPGLRLFVGGTASGKNTTCLALLREIAGQKPSKIISIEQPVEREVVEIEQVDCNTDEEAVANVESLLRQNPNVIYIAELNTSNAILGINTANTGKAVFSTLHANSCADAFVRLQATTNLPIERIVQSIHSICYQRLTVSEDGKTIIPITSYLYLNARRKTRLYGLSFGQVLEELSKATEGIC